MHRLIRMVAVLALCCAVAALPAAGRAGTYRFGVVPQQSASRLAEMWAPLLEHLSEATGHRFVFVTATDIPAFEACLQAGAYDFAYMNPYHYVVFHGRSGYEAFARAAGQRLRGIVVARAGGDVATLDDLAGAVVGFPSPAAFGASVIPQAEFAARGIAIEARYLRSHDSVYRAVAAGLIAAGGGVQSTLDGLDPELRGALVVIHRTEAYSPHAFAAAPGTPPEVVAALAAAMAAAAGAAEAAGFPGFEPARDADWDDIRALAIDPAVIPGAEGAAQCPSG